MRDFLEDGIGRWLQYFLIPFFSSSVQLKLPAYLMCHIIRQRSEPNACQCPSDAIFIHLFRFQLRQAVILNQEEIFPLFHSKFFRHLLRLQYLIPVSCFTYCFCENPANPIIVSLSVYFYLKYIFAVFIFFILFLSHFASLSGAVRNAMDA